jgi:hypothetical protein
MSKDYDYRVKFTDIRVKPPADEKAREKAKENRLCDHGSCDLQGEHPAPKRVGDGKYWFCKRHAAEYNKSFNFFDTMTDEEQRDFRENARYGGAPTWRMGAGPMGGTKAGKANDPRTWRGSEFFQNREAGKEARRANRGATGVARKALAELDLEPTAKPAEIRARYAEYVRQFHPDSNSGDRSSEEKLAKVIRAGKTLKAAGLMKD